MWKRLLTFAVAALLATPAFAQAEGKWTGQVGSGPTITFEFKVDGFKLTGTATFGNARVEISDGSIIANQVSFLSTQGGVTTRTTGIVEGDELRFTRYRASITPRDPAAPQLAPAPFPPIILKRVR